MRENICIHGGWVCVGAYTHAYVCMHVYLCTGMCICVHTCMFMYMCEYMFLCVYIYGSMSICVCVCVCTCMRQVRSLVLCEHLCPVLLYTCLFPHIHVHRCWLRWADLFLFFFYAMCAACEILLYNDSGDSYKVWACACCVLSIFVALILP